MNKPDAPTPPQSPAKPGALPAKWVERIFAAFESHYMGLWLDRVRGCDLAAIKADWARKLGGFVDSPYALAYGLAHLEEFTRPPTLPEFLAVCRRAPPPDDLPRLPYRPTREDIQKAREASRAAARAVERTDTDKVLQWARTPRSELHLKFIADAAKKHAGIAAELAQLIADGKVTESGRLVQRYMGGGIWVPTGYVGEAA